MILKLLGGNNNECIQASKLEQPKGCFEAIARVQSTKARKHFGQINRISLPRNFTSVGVELRLLVSQVGKQENFTSLSSLAKNNKNISPALSITRKDNKWFYSK